MKKYKITEERKRLGEVIGTKIYIIESNREPKVGECTGLMSDPPIFVTTIKVEKLCHI